MERGPLYHALAWGSAGAVAAALVLSWAYLWVVHVRYIEPGILRQIDRKTVVPHDVVIVFGFSALAVAVLGVALRAWRRSAPILVRESLDAYRALPPTDPRQAAGGVRGLRPREGAGRILRSVGKQLLLGGMRDCEDRVQGVSHLLVLWGFIGLFATTSLDAVVNRDADPLPIWHPVRLLGNATGVLYMAGLTLASARRALLARVRATSTRADWTFLASLWGTGATGFLVQWFADLGDARDTRWSYLAHLAFIGLILAAAPWTKFIHAAWRPTWILYSELAARKKA